jgi:UDP-2-acetamido-2,6-beta-L-arabino-hexul-4-ose reductase
MGPLLMKNILVTGAIGFIGKNLIQGLRRREDVALMTFDIKNGLDDLAGYLKDADIIFHLAGVNRPERAEEFEAGNAGLTQTIVDILQKAKRNTSLVFSSSTQAALNNPYGISKKQAEDILIEYSRKHQAKVYIYRFPNVFGKWCRPNYNSVVATFCHNIAHGLDITISDVNKEIELIYIDDVVRAFIGVMEGRFPVSDSQYCLVEPKYRISLGALAETIQGFRNSRVSLALPDMSDPFLRALYATYVSYLPADSFAYALTQRTDPRGELAELLKSPHIGQIFVSRTRPGITRGHHYHDTKVEKFVVLEGDAVIRFRHILGGDVIEYPVSGREFRVVDIPPGYTHAIENIGQNDLIVLFWADEIFNPDFPDTVGMTV